LGPSLTLGPGLSAMAQLPRIEQAGGAAGSQPAPASRSGALPPIDAEGSRPGTRGAGRQEDLSQTSPNVQHVQLPGGSLTLPKGQAKDGAGNRRVSFSRTAEEQQPQNLTKILSSFKLFKDLDPGVLRTLPEIVTSILCKAGTVLFRQGDNPGCCYVIISGAVGIYAMSEEELAQSQQGQNRGKEKDGSLLDFLPGHKTVDGFSRHHEDSSLGREVAKLGVGNVVGELALLNDQPRSASVQCTSDCEFLIIRRTDFDNILKEEMVKKGDEKLRFLMEHLPGMREVAVPKPGGKPHASYLFRRAKCTRGHTFLVQGTAAEPHIWAVFKGAVEFRRAETLRSDIKGQGEQSMPQLPGRPLSAKKKNLKKVSSATRLHGIGRDGNVAAEANDADPNGVMSRRGILVAGGVFGSLPIPVPEPFTVRVTSPTCEVFYLAGADFPKIPRKLLDTLQEYLAASTTWRLGCHQRSTSLRKANFRGAHDKGKDSGPHPPDPTPLPSTGKSMDEILEDVRKARKDQFAGFQKEAFEGTG